jgi:dTDP-4-dehydrorhamnose reductase
MERSGHASRDHDLELFAELGLRAMRYPVLWERTAPEPDRAPDWEWSDRRLGMLRDLGIEPIVGLLHHGSGPRHTGLIDPLFPEKLAAYARSVAERYPWADRYTPVNEPLTTARFSGLYGVWYPHDHDDRTFVTALLNQCRGVALAMRAIREVHPGAKLVQTEDLGRTYSTPRLSYQAGFENERRWLTHDLLCGRVDRDHPLRDYLLWTGIDERNLAWFIENPTPPDVIGVNHYVTSERFLDPRLARYPRESHGENGQHRYADVEAVRVRAEGTAGPKELIREAWDRYHIPVAVTEAHIGCRRESQIRWLDEVWSAACELRSEGADLVAVTAWSLLGTYDWNTLVTRGDGHYEPGVFDLRSGSPRPTALATMLRDLAKSGSHDHPALDREGWWRSDSRLLYPAVSAPGPVAARRTKSDARPLLIAGAAGRLGRALARACADRGIDCVALTRAELDCADRAAIVDAVERYRPWGIINAAGYVRVDDAESEPERCMRENTEAPIFLAEICASHGIALLTFSSALVFDGEKGRPYLESDRPSPLGTYAWSKATAERRVLDLLPSALVIRTSSLFGAWDESGFLALALRAMASGQSFAAADDQVISPTYLPDLVHASLDLLIDREKGIWHLAHGEGLSWAELAARAARVAGLDHGLVDRVPACDLGRTAPRPSYSVLGSMRGTHLPPLESALRRYLRGDAHMTM